MVHMGLFRDKDVFFLYARWWSRFLLKLCGIKVQVHGMENVRAGERYVYVANHASLFDIPIVIATVPDNIRIMYKKELEKIPVFGWCLKFGPYVAVRRERSREASKAITSVVESMKSGSSMLVFPEGTRSADGTVGQFKRGAFSIAILSGKPLIAVSISGSAKILPARSNSLKRGLVRVYIDPSITPSDTLSRAEELELVVSIHTTISNNVNLQL